MIWSLRYTVSMQVTATDSGHVSRSALRCLRHLPSTLSCEPIFHNIQSLSQRRYLSEFCRAFPDLLKPMLEDIEDECQLAIKSVLNGERLYSQLWPSLVPLRSPEPSSKLDDSKLVNSHIFKQTIALIYPFTLTKSGRVRPDTNIE